jgi:hypothetical protein
LKQLNKKNGYNLQLNNKINLLENKEKEMAQTIEESEAQIKDLSAQIEKL